MDNSNVSDYIFAWSGNPYKVNWWDKNYTCEIPAGEPTGENNIPAILPEFPDSMLTLKQKLCNIRLQKMNKNISTEERAQLEQQEQSILNTISLLRTKWKSMTDAQRKEAFEKFWGKAIELPGKIIFNTIAPFVYILGGLVLVGTVAVGAISYILYKTKGGGLLTEEGRRITKTIATKGLL